MDHVRAAERLKLSKHASVHPIVEGATSVLEAVATDRRALLTLDPDDPDRLFYSVPCVVGAGGVLERYSELIEGVGNELEAGKANLRRLLRLSP